MTNPTRDDVRRAEEVARDMASARGDVQARQDAQPHIGQVALGRGELTLHGREPAAPTDHRHVQRQVGVRVRDADLADLVRPEQGHHHACRVV